MYEKCPVQSRTPHPKEVSLKTTWPVGVGPELLSCIPHQDRVTQTSDLEAGAPKTHLVAPVPTALAMVRDTKTAALLAHGPL